MSRHFLIFPAAVAVIGLVLGGCGGAAEEGEEPTRQQRPQPVEVTQVTRQTLADTLLVVGSLAANESAEVRAEISGIIREIRFNDGQEVAEGDLLVQLDDRELQAQVREASVRLELARQTLARSERLLETRSISESDRDRALAEFERIRAEVDLLDVRLEKTSIRAPFAGRMGGRLASPGDLVGPSDLLSRLSDLSRLKVEFDVPERHAKQIQEGATVRVLPRAGSENDAEGTVYFVSPVIERATRSVPVKAYVDNAAASLMPGMFVQVEVVLRSRENVLTVPETAILARDGQHFLVLVNENNGQTVVAFQPVRVGLRQRGMVEVTPQGAEVPEGQQVVAAGLGALPLFPGAPVEPRPMRSAGRSVGSL